MHKKRFPTHDVTTELLQRARRSAQRKRMPRAMRAKGLIAVRNDDIEIEPSSTDLTSENSILVNAIPFKHPIIPPLRRVCCAGYCPVRIGGMLRQLPESVLSSAAQITRVSHNIGPFHFAHVLQAKHDARLRPNQCADGAYARRLLENSSLAHLTVATQTKKCDGVNRPFLELLGKDEYEIQRMEFDLDILFNDLDCLCLFLCDLLRDQTMPGEPRINYTRVRPGGQVHRQCMLVCWCCHSILDSKGQVMEVTVGYVLRGLVLMPTITTLEFRLTCRCRRRCRSATPSIPSRPRSTTPPPTTSPSPARCAL